MRPVQHICALMISVGLLWTAASAPIHAQSFYAGRTIEIYVGFGSGGAYDLYARLLARHIGRFIAGTPAIVTRNMEGAGSLRLANWLYQVAPRDGTVLGTLSRGIPFEPMFGNADAQFEPTRFSWIGSTNNEVSTCVLLAGAGVGSIAQAQAREVVVGSSAPSADTYMFPQVLNRMAGTRFKVITGYRGGNDIDLAMERGEVAGRCGWSWSALKATRPDWLAEKRVRLLLQFGLAKHAELADVPLVLELARSPEDLAVLRLLFSRQVMGWPYVAPPGVPAERTELLRRAFMAALADAALLAEARKMALEVIPVTGAEIDRLIGEAYASPPAVIARAAAVMK